MARENKAKTSPMVLVVAMVAALSGLLFGFDTGVISGALLFLKKDFQLTAWGQESLVSAVLVGCILGVAASGKLCDRLGRRRVLMGCAAVFLVGSATTALANSLAFLTWGRLVVGVGIGVASFAAPLYISEIAPAKVRGALVSLNQLMITIGIVVSYLTDDLFAGLDQGWRYMFLMGAIPALILGGGMLFLPASPRWLVFRGEEEKAREVLARLNPDKAAEKELEAIKQTAHNQPGGTWSELAEPWVRPALLVGVGIMFVQQATGINTVIYYAPTIFQMAGFASDTAAITATLGVGLVNVLFTVVSIRLIDRVGRKPLLSWGLICMVISLFALGGAFWLAKILGPSLRWIAVASLFIYIAGFAVSLGPVAWLLIAEIYPLKIRGLAMSLATLSNWVFNLAIAMSFLTITETLGKAQTFWLYALVGLGGWFFCRMLVPETKGSSLEVIEANLRAGKPPRDIGEPLP